MPPQISPVQHRADVADGAEGNFFTNKIGPLPMWVWLAAGGVVLYVLYTKFFGGTSTGTPAVSTTPSTDTTTGTPFDNFGAALAQIQANENAIATLVGSGSGPSPATAPKPTSSTMSNTPAAAYTAVTSTNNPSQGAPTAPPIDSSGGTLRPAAQLTAPILGVIGSGGGPNTTGRSSGTQIYHSPATIAPITKPTFVPAPREPTAVTVQRGGPKFV